MSSIAESLPLASWRSALALWTVGIWGSRLRNAFADDELAGAELVSAVVIAAVFVALGIVVGVGAVTRRWHWSPLIVLAIIGILRWTIRGPIILLSDEWSVGFKVVHTILWLVTVALSLLALRQHRQTLTSTGSDVGIRSHGSAGAH